MADAVIVSDEAFEYLKWQAGDIYDLHDDRELWQSAYECKLRNQFASIAPYIPANCMTVLDVGSGLGGIDAVLNDNIDENMTAVLLDGDKTPSKPESSDRPHNSMALARKFLANNELYNVETMSPGSLWPVKADLVLSFAAWCFHIAPSVYLDFVASCCGIGTVIILDVRRGKTDWNIDLASAFREIAVIHEAPKFQRKVFILAG